MDLPLKEGALSALKSYERVDAEDVVRILETVRDCYSVNTRFGLPDGETNESVAEKNLIYNEINTFIIKLKEE